MLIQHTRACSPINPHFISAPSPLGVQLLPPLKMASSASTMTTTAPPLKSILKKPSPTSQGQKTTKMAITKVPPKPAAPKNTVLISQGTIGPNGRRLPTPEAREIALYHAHLIQNQKNLELSILASIERLLDFPTTPNHASDPSESDIVEFKRNMIHFRPSDYDDLIEERNIISKCGYALCPLPNKLQPTKAKYRVLDKGRRIVETKQLERFCGEECARRGLWIRVQLSEEPSWLRVGPDGEVGKGGVEYRITLLEEERKENRTEDTGFQGDVKKLANQLQTMGIAGTGLSSPTTRKQSLENKAKLSKSSTTEITQPKSPKIRELVTISERVPTPTNIVEPPKPSTVSTTDDLYTDKLTAQIAALAVEGYTPKGANKDFAAKWKDTVGNLKSDKMASNN
ncbi:Rtr1/RPAP2 family-domain-containing protein [Kalaharituber pfeilii]|nr:Rtr1/RPAP2 family-domain-containing protein [Kalaharituber pfeilii]